jgi:hypothetical protein
MFFIDEFYTLTFSTDFLYVRFIGDRSIDEKDFGKILYNRVSEMNNWANEIKNAEIGKGNRYTTGVYGSLRFIYIKYYIKY